MGLLETASTLAEQGHYALAIEAFQEAKDAGEDGPTCLEAMAQLQNELGLLEDAKKSAFAAVTLKPKVGVGIKPH
jgi:hypothetical protein